MTLIEAIALSAFYAGVYLTVPVIIMALWKKQLVGWWLLLKLELWGIAVVLAAATIR